MSQYSITAVMDTREGAWEDSAEGRRERPGGSAVLLLLLCAQLSLVLHMSREERSPLVDSAGSVLLASE